MVKDAESHATQDKDRRESIEQKNNLDSMIYQGEKQLAENGEKLDEGLKTALESALAEAKQDLESDEAGRIAAGLERLQAQLHKVAEELYKAESAGAPGSPGSPGSEGAADAGAAADAGGPGADDDVIDAEYTEEDKS
jgi:molecular chaperone DnaK